MKKSLNYILIAMVSTFVLVGCEKKQEAPKVPDAPKAPEVPAAPKAP